jgi:chromosome segregation ATPase
LELQPTVSQTETPTLQSLESENAHLREELQMKDQLVQQLSQELFRLVKGKNNFVAPQQPAAPERNSAQMKAMREQLEGLEQQLAFYQEQVGQRDAELFQLRQSVQELTDRSRMLEQVVQELPIVYREKFAERMEPVKEKVAMLQRENRQLHAELQSVSYRLAVRTRRGNGQLDLPSFSPSNSPLNLPSFGNA